MSAARAQPPASAKVANFVLFQVGWLLCVLGNARQPWLGPAWAAAVVGAQVSLAGDRRRELAVVVALTAVGVACDSALAALGLLRFPPQPMVGVLPAWFVALWVLFAGTPGYSMAWTAAHPRLAAALGAVAGPLCYLAGERLGALHLAGGGPALGAIAVSWTLVMSATARLARWRFAAVTARTR